MTYLHGIETIQSNAINMTITPMDISSVIVIGTSPIAIDGYPKITNYSELAQYAGNNIDGFTLSEACETILKESEGADIYPINIYDRTKHTIAVEKSITFTDGKCELTELDVFNLKLTQSSDDKAIELEYGSDYTFENNVITLVKPENSKNIKASYKYADLTKITDSDVIGGVDAEGKRSGLQRIYELLAENGINIGIIIAPGFTSKNIRNAIEEITNKLRCISYLDAPKGVTVPLAEKARLREYNKIDLTGTSENVIMAMPYVKRYNQNQNTTTLKPLSPVLAGIRVRLDRERNIAKSIDNTVSKTILGLEYPMYYEQSDANCDVQRVNALGITTVFNYDGEYRVFGAHNMSFKKDVNTGLMTFESAKRTRNFINLSIEKSSFNCVGENITQGFIDDVLNGINSFFAARSNPLDRKNQLLYEGTAYYDETKNTAENLASGHITFSYKACPLATAEHITFEDVLDITIITKTLGA